MLDLTSDAVLADEIRRLRQALEAAEADARRYRELVGWDSTLRDEFFMEVTGVWGAGKPLIDEELDKCAELYARPDQ